MSLDIPEYPTFSRGALLCTFDGGYASGRWALDWASRSAMQATAPCYLASNIGTTIRAMGVSPRGDLIAAFVSSSTANGFLRVETTKGELLLNKALVAGYFSSGYEQVEFHPNGRWVAVSGNGFVEITDIVTGEQIWQTATGAYSLSFSPNGAYFAFGQTTAFVVRTDTWAAVTSKTITSGASLSGLEWSQDSTKLFCSALSTTSSTSYWNLQLYDITAGVWRGHATDTFFSVASVSQNAQHILGLIPNHNRTGVWVIRGGQSNVNLVLFDGVRERTATLPYTPPTSGITHWAREVGGYAAKNGGTVLGHIPMSPSSGSGFFYLVQAVESGLDFKYYMGTSGVSPSPTRRSQLVFARVLGEISNRDTTPITDSEGNPLSDVTVRALNRSDFSFLSTATTDVSGRFELPMPNAAPCMVIMRAPSDNYNSQIFDWVVAK